MSLAVLLAFVLPALAGRSTDAATAAQSGDLAALQALHAERPLKLEDCCLRDAISGRQPEVLRWMFTQGVSPDAVVTPPRGMGDPKPALFAAIQTLDGPTVAAVAQAGASLDASFHALPPLGFAVDQLSRSEQLGPVDALLAAGADPNAKAARGSGMQLACYQGHLPAVARLAARGGDLSDPLCAKVRTAPEVLGAMADVGVQPGPGPVVAEDGSQLPAGLPPLPAETRPAPDNEHFRLNAADAQGVTPYPDAPRWRLWQEVVRGIGLFDEDLLAWRALGGQPTDLFHCSPDADRCLLEIETSNPRLCLVDAAVAGVEQAIWKKADLPQPRELEVRCSALPRDSVHISSASFEKGTWTVTVDTPGTLGGRVTFPWHDEAMAETLRMARTIDRIEREKAR